MWADKNSVTRLPLPILCLLLAQVASTVPARCDSRQPIRRQSVRAVIADFLRLHGWGELPQNARLDWPEFIPSADRQVGLQVAAAAWDSRLQAVQFHLRCAPHSACIDFLVRVAAPASTTGDWARRLAATMSSPLAPNAGPSASRPLLAKRGQAAVLILQGGGLRVSLPVICAEPGVLHQRIRVIDRHSQRSFYADVVGEALLSATL